MSQQFEVNDVLLKCQNSFPENTLKDQGGFLMQSGGFLTDNLAREANVIVTDVPATNGLIHVIDAVICPLLHYKDLN